MDAPLIVITDDDSSDRFLVKLAFEEAGVNVQVAEFEDGAELIDFISGGCGDKAPHLILLDLNMPKRSGIEVLQYVKDNPADCNPPIVVLSTSSDPGDINKSKALGAVDYIVKPSDYSGYLDVVKQLAPFLKS